MTVPFPVPEFGSLVTGRVTLRRVDPQHDAAMLRDWFDRPEAGFWGMSGKSTEDVRRKYSELQATPGVQALLGVRAADAVPLFLLETYAPARDVIADHIRVQAGDLGFHFMNAPPPGHVPGHTQAVIQVVIAHLLADPAVSRLIVEPDIRNERMLGRMVQAGFERWAVVHLRRKTALVMVLSRSRREALMHQGARLPCRPPLSRWAVRWHLLVGRIGRKLGLLPQRRPSAAGTRPA